MKIRIINAISNVKIMDIDWEVVPRVGEKISITDDVITVYEVLGVIHKVETYYYHHAVICVNVKIIRD